MKKKVISMILTAVSVLTFSFFALSACNTDKGSYENVTITLAEKEITILEGESKKLTVSIAPVDAMDKNVSWKSDDASIATVSDGVVKGIKAGQTTVKVSSNGKTDTCKVTVKAVVTDDDSSSENTSSSEQSTSSDTANSSSAK